MSIFVMPGHESEGSVIFRNVYKCLPVVTALQSRRLEPLATPLWEIYMCTSHKLYIYFKMLFIFFLETKGVRFLEILKL